MVRRKKLVKKIPVKRGKRAAVSFIEQKIVIEQFEDKFKNSLPPPSDVVYSDIVRQLNKRMTVKAVYLSIKRNYEHFFSATTTFAYKKLTDDYTISESDRFSNSECSESYDTYDFLMDCHKWQQIEPQVFYTHRNDSQKPNQIFQRRIQLPTQKWSDIISKELWSNTQLPCIWCMKNHQVYQAGSIKCNGYCNQCHASVEVIIKPTPNTDYFMSVHCAVKGYDKDFKHNPGKKKRMTSEKRRDLKKRLYSKSAIVVQSELANDFSSDERESPFIPNLQTLRQIKSETRKENILHSNPVLSLVKLSTITPFSTCIKQVSARPFYVQYWLQEQIECYKKILRKEGRISVSLDATGSVCRNVERAHKSDDHFIGQDNSKHVFLYMCFGYSSQGSSVPLTQMLSESQTAETICRWLESWIVNLTPPNEAITDDSAALISAVVKSLAKCPTTKDYISNCFKLLENQTSQVPPCFVRLDTSHFCKTLSNLPCFQGVDTHIKWFYVNCIKFIKMCQDYQIVKEVVWDLILTSTHQYAGDDKNGSSTLCSNAINRLKVLIYGGNAAIERANDTTDLDGRDTKAVIGSILVSDIDQDEPVSWLNEFIERNKLISILENDGDQLNPYYLPKFLDVLKHLILRLPLFSNVMCRFFYSDNLTPSSSNCESAFNILKNFLLKNFNMRLRVDDFLVEHHDFLKGVITLALRNISKIQSNKSKGTLKATEKRTFRDKSKAILKHTYNNDNETTFPDESVFKNNPRYCENWRGLIKRPKSRGRPKKKTKQNKVTSESCIKKRITILKNGGYNIIDNNPRLLYNTCAFDSVAQSIAVACVDNDYLNIRAQNPNNDFFHLVRCLINDDFKSDIDSRRLMILSNHYNSSGGVTSIEKGPIIIDCQSNVCYIFEKVVLLHLYSAIRKSVCSNEKCNVNEHQRLIAMIPLDADVLNKGGIAVLNKAVYFHEIGTLCIEKNCNGIRKSIYNVSDIISFDLNEHPPMALTDIPQNLLIKDEIYRLLSAIQYCGDGTTIGHYRAHCLRKDKQWQCYDDLCDNVINSDYTEKIQVHCVLYTRVR
jgi:hypothetical protein